jgi:hypothetical protein
MRCVIDSHTQLWLLFLEEDRAVIGDPTWHLIVWPVLCVPGTPQLHRRALHIAGAVLLSQLINPAALERHLLPKQQWPSRCTLAFSWRQGRPAHAVLVFVLYTQTSSKLAGGEYMPNHYSSTSPALVLYSLPTCSCRVGAFAIDDTCMCGTRSAAQHSPCIGTCKQWAGTCNDMHQIQLLLCTRAPCVCRAVLGGLATGLALIATRAADARDYKAALAE